MNEVPPELAFEYKAIVNIEIGLVLSEDHVLRDTATAKTIDQNSNQMVPHGSR